MSSELRTERIEHTLVFTLADPDTRNALSPQMCAAGVEALNVAESSEEVRCVVLTGADGSFCSGALFERHAAPGGGWHESARQEVERFHRLVEAIRAFPKPVIAAVEGTAVQAGSALALACDLIVAARDARFALDWVEHGLSPHGGTSSLLMQALPRQLVAEWLWLAEPLAAEQLRSHGLVNRVTDRGQALAHALEIAARLGTRSAASLAGTKELLNLGPGRSLSAQLDDERDALVHSLRQGPASADEPFDTPRTPPD